MPQYTDELLAKTAETVADLEQKVEAVRGARRTRTGAGMSSSANAAREMKNLEDVAAKLKETVGALQQLTAQLQKQTQLRQNYSSTPTLSPSHGLTFGGSERESENVSNAKGK